MQKKLWKDLKGILKSSWIHEHRIRTSRRISQCWRLMARKRRNCFQKCQSEVKARIGFVFEKPFLQDWRRNEIRYCWQDCLRKIHDCARNSETYWARRRIFNWDWRQGHKQNQFIETQAESDLYPTTAIVIQRISKIQFGSTGWLQRWDYPASY